jgi:hypothetical protein
VDGSLTIAPFRDFAPSKVPCKRPRFLGFPWKVREDFVFLSTAESVDAASLRLPHPPVLQRTKPSPSAGTHEGPSPCQAAAVGLRKELGVRSQKHEVGT